MSLSKNSLEYKEDSPYHTRLTSDEQQQFTKWVLKNGAPYDNTKYSDYDMPGFWKALTDPNDAEHAIAQANQSEYDKTMHYPDYWKTPYHDTMSTESKYATGLEPSWFGNRLIDQGGWIQADQSQNPISTDAPLNQNGIMPTPTNKGLVR